MNEITNQAIMWKIISRIMGIILPILILIIWKRKFNRKGSLKPAIVGAVTFILFSQVLENIPKLFFFNGVTSISKYVWTHAWAYVLVGCLLAGIFEEVGRYVAFRFFLKRYRNNQDAITYGIGHGGIESILVLGITAISSIRIAIAVNNGELLSLTGQMNEIQLKSLELQIATLSSYGVIRMFVEVIERVIAMILHISLSVVVFYAVKENKKKYLLQAMILHAVFDVPAAMYQCGVINIWLAEVLLLGFMIVCVMYARKFIKSHV